MYMESMRINKKLNNAGLSLVELLISVAMLAIVSIAIAAFMSTGSVSYAKTSAEVDLQYDAQLAMNQLQDYLIDATEGAEYTVDGASITAGSDDFDTGSSKVLTIMTVNKKDATYFNDDKTDDKYYADIITWTGDDGSSKANTLYYERRDVTKTPAATPSDYPTYSLAASSMSPVLMSEYITGFTVDFSNLEKKDAVSIAVRYKKGSREYETSHNVAIRNDLALFTPGTVSGGPGGPGGGLTGIVSGITITPSTVVAGLGSTHTFSTLVLGTGAVSQDVTWSTDPDFATTDLGTYIDFNTVTGKTTIKPIASPTDIPDILKHFKVVATCKENPETDAIEANFSATANIYVKEAMDLSLSAPATCKQNEVANLSATVNGLNITSSAEDQAVVWTISSGAAYVTQVGPGQYRVKDIAPVGATFTIKVTSALNSSLTKEATITVLEGEKEAPPADDSKIEIDGVWPTEIKRGETGTFKVKTSDASNYEVQWGVKFSAGGKDYDEGSVFTVVRSGNTCKISVLKSFDYTVTNAKISVTAYLVPKGSKFDDNNRNISGIVTVDPVRIELIDAGSIKSAITKDIYFAARTDTQIAYKLYGIDNTELEWVVSRPEIISAVNDAKDSKLKLHARSITLSGRGITVRPKVGSKYLSGTITCNVSGGNIEFSQWMNGEKKDYVAYMPIPTDPDFPGDPKYRYDNKYNSWELGKQKIKIDTIDNGDIYMGYYSDGSETFWRFRIYVGIYDTGYNWVWYPGMTTWEKRQ